MNLDWCSRRQRGSLEPLSLRRCGSFLVLNLGVAGFRLRGPTQLNVAFGEGVFAARAGTIPAPSSPCGLRETRSLRFRADGVVGTPAARPAECALRLPPRD